MKKESKIGTHNKKYKIIAIIIIVLVGLRIALPYVVLHYANKSLANLKSLSGHIADIDIALYKGAYKINDIYINKKDSVSGDETKFFKSDIIELSLEWSALFKGRFVGELVFERPFLIFTKDKAEPKDIQKDSSDLNTLLGSLMPLKLNRVEIKEGVIKYIDQTSKPAVDIQMDNTYILAQNLSSVVDSSLMPSTIKATSNVYGGTLQFNMKLNALKDKPTFDLNAELNNMQLPKLNEFFQAYANFDVNKGTLGLYIEIAAKEGKFIGYVKPIIKDLDVVGKEDRKNSFWQKTWESIVGAAGVIFRNPKKEQVATKVPLSGSFDKANSDIWYAIIDLFRNAFIQALQPSIDFEISIESVDKEIVNEEKKGILKKVFGGKSKKEKREEKNKKKEEKKSATN
jgi:hypothetical protein